MEKQTLGATIAALRKGMGMTQLELAEKMGVTDKAVSKWERDLSVPDVHSIPKLAQILGVSVEELMQVKKPQKSHRSQVESIADTALKGVGAAMGIAVTVLSILGKLGAGRRHEDAGDRSGVYLHQPAEGSSKRKVEADAAARHPHRLPLFMRGAFFCKFRHPLSKFTFGAGDFVFAQHSKSLPLPARGGGESLDF